MFLALLTYICLLRVGSALAAGLCLLRLGYSTGLWGTWAPEARATLWVQLGEPSRGVPLALSRATEQKPFQVNLDGEELIQGTQG